MPIGTGMFKILYDPKKDYRVIRKKGKSFADMLGQIKLKPIIEE